MNDLYSQLKEYEKTQATKFPTSGTIQRIDGSFVDVAVRGMSSILRHVKCVGTPSSTGQIVVLTWENSIPTAHVTGGSASSTDVALVRGPQGPEGPQGTTGSTGAQGPQGLVGPTGPQGAQGPKGDTGSQGIQGPVGPTGSVSAAGSIGLTELAVAPATPAAGTLAVYAKTDHKVYKKSSDGTEAEIGASRPMRELLTAARTYYVRTDGSDSNTGLTNTAGGAFLTIQKAYDVIVTTLDTAGYTVTIQVADGTYTAGLACGYAWAGAGMIKVVGNAAAPQNVLINAGAGMGFYSACILPAILYIQGFKLQGSYGIRNDMPGQIQYIDMQFGAITNQQVVAQNAGAAIVMQGNVTINGGAGIHIYAQRGGMILLQSGVLTISGTPAFTQWAQATQLGIIRIASGVTFSNPAGATGTKYLATINGVISTNGQTLPGSVTGSVSTGGQYA